MGEEVKVNDYENGGGTGTGTGSGDDERVLDWEAGLPGVNDLTPLAQALIPTALATAFRISPEPSRSMLDVNRESHKTLNSIRGGGSGGGGGGGCGGSGSSHHSQTLSSSDNFNNFKSFNDELTGTQTHRENMIIDMDETDLTREGSDSRKTRRIMETGGGATEEADSSAAPKNSTNNNENFGEDVSARTLKRPRLVWTPQLHKRFVDVVAHLGIKNAVPKTIMQLMNVEGLTRENVASHLQKYRLYLKRMQGLSSEGPSSSDHLFASTPVPQSLHDSVGVGSTGAASGQGHGNSNGHAGMPIPMPYPPPAGAQIMPVQMIGMAGANPGGFHGYGSHHHHQHHHHHHQYNMVQQQRDWSGNKFGSVAAAYHHHVAPNDN